VIGEGENGKDPNHHGLWRNPYPPVQTLRHTRWQVKKDKKQGIKNTKIRNKLFVSEG